MIVGQTVIVKGTGLGMTGGLDGRPATVIDVVGPMHLVAFHDYLIDGHGTQVVPWLHERNLTEE